MREGKRGQGARVAGNKRLANPSCQFNLASNPGEMLIRTSPPPMHALSFSSSLPPCHCVFALSRATQRHFIFAQRYRRATGLDHVEIVCKASCARRTFLFSRLPRARATPLSAFHPRNLSRLCVADARRNLYRRGTSGGSGTRRALGGFAILSSCLDHPGPPPSPAGRPRNK